MGKKNNSLKKKERMEKSRAWQKANRERLRKQGIRLIQVTVPEGNIDMIRSMCRRLTARHVEMLNQKES